MWQRFTERARKVVFYAQEEAQKFDDGYVSTEHLLLGLVREPDSGAARVLEKLGVGLSRIRAEVEKQLPRGESRPSQDMTLTPRAKRVIDLAYDEARNLNNNYIGTEHLLLGLIREGDGLAGRVLYKLGVELDAARQATLDLQDAGGAEGIGPGQPQTGKGRWRSFHLWPVPEGSETLLAGLEKLLQNVHLGKLAGGSAVAETTLVMLLSDRDGEAAAALEDAGFPIEGIMRELQRELLGTLVNEGHASSGPTMEDLLAASAKEARDLAAKDEAETPLRSGDLLLAAVRLAPQGLRALLDGFDLTLDAAREAVRERRSRI